MRSGWLSMTKVVRAGFCAGAKPDEGRAPGAGLVAARWRSGSAPSPSCRRRYTPGCGRRSRSRPRSPSRASAAARSPCAGRGRALLAGPARTCSAPLAEMVASTRRGVMSSPPLATALYASRIWSGVTASPVPIGTVPIEEADQVLGSFGLGTMPSVSPGQPRPVGWPKPRSRRKYERRSGPRQVGDLDRPDVRGLGEDLGGSELLGRVVVGVVERPAPERDLVGHGEDRARGDQPVLQGARDRHELHDRARLVDRGDGQVLVGGDDLAVAGPRRDRPSPGCRRSACPRRWPRRRWRGWP